VLSRHEERLEPGETRLAAVLFLDVVGFTAMSRALSPEQLTLLIDRTFRIFELTVQSWGGYCDKVIGDAALYVFAGHPNYPPVCEAALRAALKLRERTDQVNESLRDTALSIAIRAGVSFGQVTRRQVGGAEQQVTVMGETVNIAQRLETAARPGAVLTTVRVLEKAGDLFRSRSLGKRELKGFGPVEVYELEGVDEPPVQLRGAFARLTPLVGRKEILSAAMQRVQSWLATSYPPDTWDIARVGAPPPGRNRLLILRGVAAVGKSRLAYEIVQALYAELSQSPAAGPGLANATAHCSESASIRSFVGELAQVAGLTAQNLPGRWAELCGMAERAVSADYALRQRRHLEALAHVLDCPAVDTAAMAQSDRASFLTSCVLALRACCELAALEGIGGAGDSPATAWDAKRVACPAKPVILVIEDLQWLGGLGEVLHGLLSGACLPQPLVVIGTARPEYEPADAEGAASAPVVLEVQSLDAHAGHQLVQAMLPGLELPAALESELHEKAAGLPYYYEEFCRMLLRRGIIKPAAVAAYAQVAADSPPAPPLAYAIDADVTALDIPENINTLVLGRLDQLAPPLKALAQRASVLGRAFDCELLLEIEEALGYDAARLDEALGKLVDEKVFVQGWGEEPAVAGAITGTFFYAHRLTRDVAYDSLLKRNRRVLHGLAAKAFQRRYRPGAADEWSLLPAMIEHYAAAEMHPDAHALACELLMLMARTGQHQRWEDWESAARNSWDMLRSWGAVSAQASPALLRAQAVRAWRHGELSHALELYQQALSTSRVMGDAIEESKALGGSGVVLRSLGQMEQAVDHYQRAREMMHELGLRADEARMLINLGNVAQSQGRHDAARGYFEHALAVSRELGYMRLECSALSALGVLYEGQASAERAMECYTQALDLARRVGDRVSESGALMNLGSLHCSLGECYVAENCYQQALTIDREIGNCSGEGHDLYNLADLHLGRNDLPAAEGLLRAALRCFDTAESSSGRAMALVDLGEVLRRLGRLAEAGQVLDEAMVLLSSGWDLHRLCLLQCHRVLYFCDTGDTAAIRDALCEAERHAAALGVDTQSPIGRSLGQAREAAHRASSSRT
jgi:adenylate cyclase